MDNQSRKQRTRNPSKTNQNLRASITQERVKEAFLSVFCIYVMVYVTAYLLRLIFVRQAFNSEEIWIVPALFYVIFISGKKFLRLMEDVD